MEAIEILSTYFIVIIYHLVFGVLFAAIALGINYYIPYTFSDKPKDNFYRKIVFYGILVLILAMSLLGDLFYVWPSTLADHNLGDVFDPNNKRGNREFVKVKSTLIITCLLTLIAYGGLYYGIASAMLKSNLRKCYSVFKFK